MDDLNVLENFVFGDTPERSAIVSLVDDLFGRGEFIEVGLYSLSAEHDIRPLVLRTLLTYLQLDGLLEEATPIYSAYQFVPHMSSAEMFARFDPQRQEFLRKVFSHADKKKKWFHIDLEQAAQSLGEPRDRIVKALDYLAEQNLLELKPSKLVHRYRRLQEPDDRNSLVESLFSKMQDRERRDIERLGEVVSLLTDDGCQVNRLNAHFGEERTSDCGHCSRCLTPGVVQVPERIVPAIDNQIWQQVSALRVEQPVLQSPVLLTRFLCGVTSPRLSKARLGRHALNGKLAHVPFRVVLEAAKQQASPTG